MQLEGQQTMVVRFDQKLDMELVLVPVKVKTGIDVTRCVSVLHAQVVCCLTFVLARQVMLPGHCRVLCRTGVVKSLCEDALEMFGAGLSCCISDMSV